MKNTVDQFMWDYQRHFRRAAEDKTEAALSTIGLAVEIRAVLVGFAISDDARHRVCIEPEDGPLNSGHLSGVPDRARELYDADPQSEGLHFNPIVHDRRHAYLLRQHRADALTEAIGASGVFEEFTFFASESAPIGKYEVHTCVGVPTVTLEALPALEGPIVDQAYVGQSLQHEVIAECLHRADNALYLPDPGEVGTFTDRPENIIQAAARRFTRVIGFRVGGTPTDLFDEVNAFTSLSYERAAADGHLVVANRQNAPDRTLIRFQRPVSLRDSKIMRKLLELSDKSTSVITDGQMAYGLGTREPTHGDAEITVRGRAEWELRVDGALMRVTYGKAKLPSPPLTRPEVDETAQRTIDSIDMDLIWPIIEAARHSGYGMMLVVANNPEKEAERLGGQAVRIDPEHLPSEGIARLGRVDGAVLLGPDGRCHAFGVILDGVATPHGDPARGSRFNSAVRYQKMVPDALLIVISDDGPVTLIPNLKPKVHRDKIETAVQAFCEACTADPIDEEEVWRRHRQVKDLAFYLNNDQCQRVNHAYEDELNHRFKAGGWAGIPTPLRPDPEMDESYFHETHTGPSESPSRSVEPLGSEPGDGFDAGSGVDGQDA